MVTEGRTGGWALTSSLECSVDRIVRNLLALSKFGFRFLRAVRLLRGYSLNKHLLRNQPPWTWHFWALSGWKGTKNSWELLRSRIRHLSKPASVVWRTSSLASISRYGSHHMHDRVVVCMPGYPGSSPSNGVCLHRALACYYILECFR